MKILAIDTSGELGSIAIAEGERVIEEFVLPSGDGFADIVFGEIENLLVRNGLKVSDVGGFAAASGPGTFTGVRVGLAAAKGLAEAMSRKLVAVSNLRALAHFGVSELRAPFIDARRGEIYGGVYNFRLEAVRDEVVMKQDAWLAALPLDAEVIRGPRPLAGAMAMIGAREFAAGKALDPAAVDANYVRRCDAEMLWKDVKTSN